MDQSRKRTMDARVSAVAADTANAVALADRLSAFALSHLSNQPVPVSQSSVASSNGRTKGSDIVEILYQSGNRYRVRYGEPVGNPEQGWIGVNRMDTQAEYMEIVLAFRAAQKASAVVVEDEEDEVGGVENAAVDDGEDEWRPDSSAVEAE